MKRILAALFLVATPALASFQPVTGSTVTIFPTQGGNIPVSGVGNFGVTGSTVGIVGSISNTGFSVTGSTVGIVNVGGTITTNVQGSTVGVVAAGGFFNVTGSTVGIVGSFSASGSSVTVFNSAGQTLTISGNVGQAGTYVVTPGTGAWNVTNSTVGVVAVGLFNVTGSTIGIDGIASDNGAAAATDRTPTLPGIYQTGYLNGTAATQGRNAAMSVGTDGLSWVATYPGFRPASFSASTGTINSATSANYIAAVCGNATNTAVVYGLRVSCTQTTAGEVTLGVVKTTAPFTAVFGTMTVVAHDSTMNVAVSSAIWFQANATSPVLNSSSPYLDNIKVGCMATTTAGANDFYAQPSGWRMKAIALRGVSQCIAVTLNNSTVTGGQFTASFDWMEMPTITP